jgi:hypothetical protein
MWDITFVVTEKSSDRRRPFDKPLPHRQSFQSSAQKPLRDIHFETSTDIQWYVKTKLITLFPVHWSLETERPLIPDKNKHRFR